MAARADLTGEERDYLAGRLREHPPRQLSNEGDAALRRGDYRAAAAAWSKAARLMPSEQMLVRKAWLMRVAPRLIGPVLRRRQTRREDALGFDSSFEH
jgi:outer membrane protein assembly factor BamD (BamD/ComL family)